MAQTHLPGGLGTLDWGNWVYGLVSGFISGGAAAVVSGTIVSIKDPKDFGFGSGNFFQLVGWVFLASGVLAAMNYLHSKPLPSLIQTETTTTRREIESTDAVPVPPPAVVTTTVKETRVEPLPLDKKD